MEKSLELEYRDTLREAIKLWGVPIDGCVIFEIPKSDFNYLKK